MLDRTTVRCYAICRSIGDCKRMFLLSFDKDDNARMFQGRLRPKVWVQNVYPDGYYLVYISSGNILNDKEEIYCGEAICRLADHFDFDSDFAECLMLSDAFARSLSRVKRKDYDGSKIKEKFYTFRNAFNLFVAGEIKPDELGSMEV